VLSLSALPVNLTTIFAVSSRSLIVKGAYSVKHCSTMASLVNAVDISKEETGKTLKRIGTHNGTFHCDETLKCFMIHLTHKFLGA